MEKQLVFITDEQIIDIAKIIDNDFVGNARIDIEKSKYIGKIYVTGHSDGKQCVNCQVRITRPNWECFTYVEISDQYGWRSIMPQTIFKIQDYMKNEGFHKITYESIKN